MFSDDERKRLVEEGRELIGQSTTAETGVDQIPFIGDLIGRGLTYFVPGYDINCSALLFLINLTLNLLNRITSSA